METHFRMVSIDQSPDLPSPHFIGSEPCGDTLADAKAAVSRAAEWLAASLLQDSTVEDFSIGFVPDDTVPQPGYGFRVTFTSYEDREATLHIYRIAAIPFPNNDTEGGASS